MLFYDRIDSDVLFLIHVAALNTDLSLLKFPSKDHNLEETVNEKRSDSLKKSPN